jgi:hypothetical protein
VLGLSLLLILFAETAGRAAGPAAFPGDIRAEDVRTSRTIAPGIELVEIKRGDFGPWTIHALILDPARVRLGLGIALDEIVGSEPVSSIAARHGADAAVNGGYFRTTGLLKGEPAGMLAVGGKILSEPARGRASLAVTNAGGRLRLAIAQVTVRAELQVQDGPSCAVDGFNRDRGPNELIILTPEFHRTTLTDPSGMEAVVKKGRIVELRDRLGSAPIPEDGFVISGRGAARDWMRLSLKPGAGAALKTALEARPALPFVPEFILGGGPRLLAEGKPVPSEAAAYPSDFYGTRHPRTAAGLCGDGTIVLAVVDGRQPKISVGFSIDELAGLMAELGCVEAINMDGGGSSTMVVGGRVVNSPSDAAGERPVSDALLIFKK